MPGGGVGPHRPPEAAADADRECPGGSPVGPRGEGARPACAAFPGERLRGLQSSWALSPSGRCPLGPRSRVRTWALHAWLLLSDAGGAAGGGRDGPGAPPSLGGCSVRRSVGWSGRPEGLSGAVGAAPQSSFSSSSAPAARRLPPRARRPLADAELAAATGVPVLRRPPGRSAAQRPRRRPGASPRCLVGARRRRARPAAPPRSRALASLELLSSPGGDRPTDRRGQTPDGPGAAKTERGSWSSQSAGPKVSSESTDVSPSKRRPSRFSSAGANARRGSTFRSN